MKLRPVVLAAACAAAIALVLTGCSPKVGTAAKVNQHEISQDDVNDEVHALGLNEAMALGATSVQEQVAAARGVVLQFLIDEKLFGDVLARMGVHPDRVMLAEQHDAAIDLLFNGTVPQTGADADKVLDTALQQRGIDTDLAPTVLRAGELQAVLLERTGASPADLPAAVAKYNPHVDVNPRYGSWDASTLMLVGLSLPSFLSLSPNIS